MTAGWVTVEPRKYIVIQPYSQRRRLPTERKLDRSLTEVEPSPGWMKADNQAQQTLKYLVAVERSYNTGLGTSWTERCNVVTHL